MISVQFQGIPFNITVIQVYALTSNAEEAEVEWFYEDLQDLLELTPKKDVLFIIGNFHTECDNSLENLDNLTNVTELFIVLKQLLLTPSSNSKTNLVLEYRMKQGKG